MNTWIVGKNSMKPYFQIKKLFTVSYIHKILLMKIISMLKKNLKNQIKDLGEFHDLYVQRDALLFADVFEDFKNKCIEIYELSPAYFLFPSGLGLQAYLKKAEVKLELLTNHDTLMMVERGIKGGICHAIQMQYKVCKSK